MNRAQSGEAPVSVCKPRVLIVDNEEMTRKIHAKNLKNWGFEPHIAQGVGKALLQDARRKARANCCHVAIVDIRLFDDKDSRDSSGLDLVPDLKPALSIIFSGYGNDRETTLRAIKEKEAFDFIGKEEPLKRLRGAIDNAAQKMHACNNGPQVEISEPLLAQSMEMLAPGKPEQICNLLKGLLPSARKIIVQPLGGAARTPSLTMRRQSIVLRVSEDDHLPVVVKLSPLPGRRSKEIQARKEYDNYQTHVKDQMPNKHYARIRDYERRWHIAGIVYDFLGGSQEQFQLFSSYYKNASTADICAALDHLFDKTWSERYRQTRRRPSVPSSLFAAYSKIWGRQEWLKRLREYAQKTAAQRTFKGLASDFLDPVHWVIKRTGLGKNQWQDASYPLQRYEAITHGDLLGDNFFVDKDQQTWIIDYERTGYGPILQDFVQLELDILVRLSDFQSDDVHDIFDLILILLTKDPLADSSPSAILSEKARKTYSVIRCLRTLAGEFVDSSDWRPYFWGLLLNTAFRTTLLEAKFTEHSVNPEEASKLKQEQQFTMLFGALICRRLDEWDKPWPPHEWKSSDISNPQPSKESPITILFLAANPLNTEQLQLDEEVRAIDEVLRKTEFRDKFKLISQWAVRIDDLQDLLLRHKPTIVHFSGHGSPTGEIVLVDQTGNGVTVSQTALSNLFSILQDNICCVVLNSCYSEAQAQGVAQHIDAVIGMSSTIDDEAAIRFASGFYRGLGFHRDLQTAFNLGCSMIDLHGLAQEDIPKLLALHTNPNKLYCPA